MLILISFLLSVSLVNADTWIFADEQFMNQKKIFIAKSMTLDELDASESLDRLKKQSDELLSQFDDLMHLKYAECYRSIGNDKFCKCLKDKLPWQVSFEEYIKITLIRASLNDKLIGAPDNVKKIVRKIRSVRDVCIQIFK